jgi:hypothetical protein
VGRASALGEGFGIPNLSPDPLERRAGRDHPFPISAGSSWRERDVAHRVGHALTAIPGEKTMGQKEERMGAGAVGVERRRRKEFLEFLEFLEYETQATVQF